MKLCKALGAATLLLFLPASAFALEAVPVATFDSPVYVAVAPGEPKLVFVVEQAGRIKVLRNEKKQSGAFLNITNIVRSPDSGGGNEQGLLSVAFAPDYATSRRFYVAFTNRKGQVEVDEFKRSKDNRLKALASSRRPLLKIPHPGATNHNGGQLQFGPDGLLYISTGDGGAVTPQGNNARKLNSLLGKILRIDPTKRTGSLPYGVPSGNPYVGKAGLDEIFAYGLRNPWRFAFDGNRIAIGDVGQDQHEEVDFLRIADAKGVNFGWPQYEGNAVFDNSRPGPDPATFPMFTYNHNGGRCAIVGGYVVRDPDVPSLKGRYLYGDLCTGIVRSFVPRVGAQRARGDAATGLTLSSLTSFGIGFEGQIYFAQRSGTVSRLEESP